ncbi:MAG: epoxyqueuosine reductase QueH [Treponema sp.]|jgi:predicted adenine nucleotide alpha hydrolase (AANH) superfamily ATPase|nr:epoxyqueuosine reductase QueH [Treponema sp.]
MKLLLHACCAPCSIACIESLGEEGLRPSLFWYNPNIHPWTEYKSRRDCLQTFAGERGLELETEDEYGLRAFIRGIYPFLERPFFERPSPDSPFIERETGGEGSAQPGGGAGTPPSRCAFCYRLRLEKTAEKAGREGFDAFSTTMLISPYQNHDLIRALGEELAGSYGVVFLYRDFRPRFREGRGKAGELGLYLQKYCGCIFSEEERYLGKKPAGSGGTGVSPSGRGPARLR